MRIIGMVCLAALASATGLHAQNTEAGPRFAPPRRIMAGEAFAGDRRLYPSPAIHDVDQDGTPDLVIGDLPGRVTFAKGLREGQTLRFLTEAPLKDAKGAPLKFKNW